MPHQLRPLAPLLAALAIAAAPSLGAQTVHQIRLENDAAAHEYRFNPATVTARAGGSTAGAGSKSDQPLSAMKNTSPTT